MKDIYLKDLRVFKNVCMEKVAIVENQLISFATQLDNGFLIDSFGGSEYDEELLLV